MSPPTDEPPERMDMTELTTGWKHALLHHDVKVCLDEEQQAPSFFQKIPAGEFLMGSRGEDTDEEPFHRVKITQPIYMTTFPVTQAQWRAVVRQFSDSELQPTPSDSQGDLQPVEQVSWHDVNQWCQLVSGSELMG